MSTKEARAQFALCGLHVGRASVVICLQTSKPREAPDRPPQPPQPPHGKVMIRLPELMHSWPQRITMEPRLLARSVVHDGDLLACDFGTLLVAIVVDPYAVLRNGEVDALFECAEVL